MPAPLALQLKGAKGSLVPGVGLREKSSTPISPWMALSGYDAPVSMSPAKAPAFAESSGRSAEQAASVDPHLPHEVPLPNSVSFLLFAQRPGVVRVSLNESRPPSETNATPRAWKFQPTYVSNDKRSATMGPSLQLTRAYNFRLLRHFKSLEMVTRYLRENPHPSHLIANSTLCATIMRF
jgi:hypothetical protein